MRGRGGIVGRTGTDLNGTLGRGWTHKEGYRGRDESKPPVIKSGPIETVEGLSREVDVCTGTGWVDDVT